MLDAALLPLSQAADIAAFQTLHALSTVPLTPLLLIVATTFAALTLCLVVALHVAPAVTYTPKPLLTGWERRSLVAIRRNLPPGWSVAFQVRAADAVQIATRSNKAKWRAIRRLGLRSLDFVLLDQDTIVRAVIELDDATHRRPDRRKSDADIDHVFHAAGIPIEHVHPRPAPHWPSIIARLTTSAAAVTAPSLDSAVPQSTSQPISAIPAGHRRARRAAPPS